MGEGSVRACVCVYTSRVQNKYFCSCGNGFSISLVYQINIVKLNYTRQCLEGFCIILRNKEKHNINLKNHAGKIDYSCLDCSEVCREQTFQQNPAHHGTSVAFYSEVGYFLSKSDLFSAGTLNTFLKESRETAQLDSGTASRCAFVFNFE